MNIWENAPSDAFHYEKLPNGKCIWHCRKDNKTYDRKAPDFKLDVNFLWRDNEKQNFALSVDKSVKESILKLNQVI